MIMTWCSDKPKPAWSEILSPNKSKLKTYIKIWKGIFNEILPFHATSWLYFYLVVKFTSVCLPVYTACKNMYKCKTQSMTFNIFLHLNCLKKKNFFFQHSIWHTESISQSDCLMYILVILQQCLLLSAWNYVTHKKFCTPESAFHFKSILKKKRDLWNKGIIWNLLLTRLNLCGPFCWLLILRKCISVSSI